MEDYQYVKVGEIQEEGDERHLPKNGWTDIHPSQIGVPNPGVFEIRRKVKLQKETQEPKELEVQPPPEPIKQWWKFWK